VTKSAQAPACKTGRPRKLRAVVDAAASAACAGKPKRCNVEVADLELEAFIAHAEFLSPHSGWYDGNCVK
jgi:hypothetical protein